MWTAENRARYQRDHLRYPSDLTDEEWQLVEPLIPPAKRGGRKRTVDIREVLNVVMYSSPPVANGVRCPKACHRAAPCLVILTGGFTTAPWSTSISTTLSECINL